jgi:hypothetical protein
MNNPSPSLGMIQVALRDGTLESADVATLKFYLQSLHGIPATPTSDPWIRECAMTLRAMIASKEAAADQKKVFRWAVIAGVAGIVAAVFGGVAIVPVVHDWCKGSSQALPPKTDKPASIPRLPPAAVYPTNRSGISSTNIHTRQ